MNPLDTLMSIDDKLVDWILHASPTTDAEKEAMKRVWTLRSHIDRQINTLVRASMDLAVAGLAQKAQQLSALNERINATAKTIGTVSDVLVAAAEVVAVAAQIIALVAV
jgi:hypothetical protein